MSFPKHLLSISDINQEQLHEILTEAKKLKSGRNKNDETLKGKNLCILTTKPSLRTRLSFELAGKELGANTVFVRNEEVGLGERESYADTARVLSGYFDCIALRAHEHEGIIELAKYSKASVINALTESEHPCQALADFLSISEIFGKLKGVNLCYVGDGNNVAVSLMLGSAILGINFTLISPNGYEPPKGMVDLASQLAKHYGSSLPIITNDTSTAQDSDVLYTDVWVSMGKEASKEKTKTIFSPYQINSKLLNNKNIPVLHCLPAHKGEEISEECFEANAEVIFNQAENRLHAQKSLLIKLLR
jgi:ornithine carbamoyltransferase